MITCNRILNNSVEPLTQIPPTEGGRLEIATHRDMRYNTESDANMVIR